MKIIQLRLKKWLMQAGPWVDDVRSGDYARNNKKLRLTKGVHVVIDQSKFPLGQAVYFDTGKRWKNDFCNPA
ncbi:Glycerol-3-phosphate dehydrogenase [Staphylococcus aureus]|uniref:Glycerol-3-phosphate dehydrogenase n=1 Tax=Staphylococcus aureus TaxID=1280 RepID=A0A380DY88_STAAU|nr:Glycerol-3-phosphate dehydrogenase [Staphylococcus aureus]